MKLTATCKHCGNIDHTRNMHKVTSYAHNYYFVCEECNEKMYSYYRENDSFVRKSAGHGCTTSIELETAERNTASNLLYEYGFIPTSDCTVDCEWKSPIWQNLSGQAQMLRSIEKFVAIDHRCGTHTNVGHPELNIGMIRRYYHSIFVPLSKYLASNPDKCKQVYGRELNRWAEGVNEYSSAMNHSNYVNVEHDTHLEFRTAKFVTGDQMMKVIKMSNEMVKCIVANFSLYATDYSTASAEDKAKRSQKAKVTGEKLVKIFQKYE